ncbi:D-alanyl-D-alanine carboxypeptidase family protein [uncultured Selenomonas sp.]|uniref:D-alanyl-D-alanine carboxypeptidase family protein n=1 Tax=uncultured Selenomonas sp. TaxID=159275 RepID=UPI0025D37AEC|nr:D-alanyl-D-alanine carboxypeptidase family protein [uncultured Selenomonas sp.]
MRKLWIIVVAVCLSFVTVGTAVASDTAEPVIAAESAIVVEASTGRVVYEKNADMQGSPASMTKMMTCLLALDELGRHQDVMISKNAAETEDVPLGLAAGDVFSADELLRGMMLASDNGAAVAIAEASAGSVGKFVTQMNDEAAKLGMKDTHFANPNGLTLPGHYSTARDMAKLARYAMTRKEFRDIVGIQQAPVRWSLPKNKVLMVENSNKLLGHYDGMTGIKTGWTAAAGGCLAASSKRNGLELIAVVMKAPDAHVRFDDARKLLDYGFAQTRLKKGIQRDHLKKSIWVKGAKQATVAVHPVEDVNYPIIGGEDPKRYTVSYDLPKIVDAPVKEGTVVGKIVLRYDGKPVGSVDLAAERVDQGFSVGSSLVSIFGWLLPRL